MQNIPLKKLITNNLVMQDLGPITPQQGRPDSDRNIKPNSSKVDFSVFLNKNKSKSPEIRSKKRISYNMVPASLKLNSNELHTKKKYEELIETLNIETKHAHRNLSDKNIKDKDFLKFDLKEMNEEDEEELIKPQQLPYKQNKCTDKVTFKTNGKTKDKDYTKDSNKSSGKVIGSLANKEVNISQFANGPLVVGNSSKRIMDLKRSLNLYTSM